MTNEEYIVDLLHKAVKFGEKLGASFIEARYDNIILTTLSKVNGELEKADTKLRKGIGIMAYYEGSEGASFTPELSQKSIEKTVATAFSIAKATSLRNKLKLPIENRPAMKEKIPSRGKIHPKDVEISTKIELLDRIDENMSQILDLKSSRVIYGEYWGDKLFVNSEGSEIVWHPLIINIGGLAIAMTDSGEQRKGMEQAVSSLGLEAFKQKESTPEYVGKKAGEYCKTNLTAKAIKSGKYSALVGPILSGVLAHESFGHLTEGDRIINGVSPLAGQLGNQLGTEHASIIDEGITDSDSAHYLPFDDQGSATQKTILLEKGILKGFLLNRGCANKLDMETTGNSRAVNYMHPPIPRMKNTYFTPGDLSVEEALEELGTGIYAIRSSGGQVGMDGNFLFQCSRGFYVEDGEIQYPIRDIALSGNILDFLKQIKGATTRFKLRTGIFGGCGKAGQFPLFVGMGGPDLLVNEVLIGGSK